MWNIPTKERLAKIIGLLENLLSGPDPTGADGVPADRGEELLAQLDAVDYIHFFFPENELQNRPSRSFLARSLVSARYFFELWQRVAGGGSAGLSAV